MKSQKLRKVFKYIKRECKFSSVKKGDLFSVIPINRKDVKLAEPKQIWVARKNSFKTNKPSVYAIEALLLGKLK